VLRPNIQSLELARTPIKREANDELAYIPCNEAPHAPQDPAEVTVLFKCIGDGNHEQAPGNINTIEPAIETTVNRAIIIVTAMNNF
jgi:hypothetical protein